MGSASWWGLRGGVRAFAVVAIGSGLVVGVATVAEAEPVLDVKGLKASCAKGNGTYTEVKNSNGSVGGACEVSGGVVSCTTQKDGTSQCGAVRYRRATAVATDTVRADNGLKLTTQGEPDSHVWKQKVSVSTLTDVCASVNGDLLASANATLGTCSTPTATFICTGTLSGTNCVGFADTTKHAKSISKQIKTVLPQYEGGTSPSTTAATGGSSPTTTTAKAPATSSPTGGTKGPAPSVSIAPR